jgi:hypothetical protein
MKQDQVENPQKVSGERRVYSGQVHLGKVSVTTGFNDRVVVRQPHADSKLQEEEMACTQEEEFGEYDNGQGTDLKQDERQRILNSESDETDELDHQRRRTQEDIEVESGPHVEAVLYPTHEPAPAAPSSS